MDGITRRAALAGLGGLAALPALPAFSQLQGDTLVIGQTGDIVSLDPAFRVDTLTGIVQRHLYEPVLTRQPDMSVGPGAATRWERLDATTWRLWLPEGRKFSNGEAVDAEAVRATIARLNAEATRSPIRSFFENLRQVTVDSPTQVTITTAGPDALFEARMTNCQLVPPRYAAEVSPQRFNEAPIGSGSYVFERWRRNEEVVLVANPNFSGPAPRFRRLVFRPIPEEIARITAVRTGAVHLVTSISPNQADALDRAGQVQVLKADSNRTMVVQFNKETPPGDNPRFRRAVGLAINRDELTRGLLKGYATSISTIYGTAIQGVPRDVRGDFPHDPEEARRLIREIGMQGAEVELAGAAGRYPLDRECALAIGAQLRRVGLNVRVRTYEYGTFANDIRSNKVAPIFIQPHGNVWLDPLPQIIAFFYSRGHWSGWKDPQLDEMIDAANTADGARRVALVGDLIRKMREDAIAIPLYANHVIYAAVPGLRWQPRPDDLIVAGEIA